jgi:hypothetical protein
MILLLLYLQCSLAYCWCLGQQKLKLVSGHGVSMILLVLYEKITLRLHNVLLRNNREKDKMSSWQNVTKCEESQPSPVYLSLCLRLLVITNPRRRHFPVLSMIF